MSQTFYSNQFKKAAVIGNSALSVNPNPYEMDAKWDPTATAGTTLLAGEAIGLIDLGANDVVASGVPIITKRTNDYDAIYGVKKFSVFKNASVPGDNIVVAKKGDIIYMQCSGAVTRGSVVSPIVGSTGLVKTQVTGFAALGTALDKGADGDIIRVELTCDNTAVAAT